MASVEKGVCVSICLSVCVCVCLCVRVFVWLDLCLGYLVVLVCIWGGYDE